MGFINIFGLKHITRLIACFVVARQWAALHDPDLIVVHGVHSPFLWFARSMRRRSRRVVVVLTDPPGVLLASDGALTRALKRLDIWLVRRALSKADGVISLTQRLIDDYAPNAQGLVLQGFVDPKVIAFVCLRPETGGEARTVSRPFTVAYAGGLSAENGVDRLLGAVRTIDRGDIRLELFGKGDLLEEVMALAARDSRFYYGGVLRPAELYPCLGRADLLINPRPSCLSFVPYSLPSKLIEYMALGVPVLTTRLAGIPSAFLDHLSLIEDETVDGLRRALMTLASTPRDQLIDMAVNAQRAVNSTATEEAQGRRIATFFQSVIKRG